MKRFMLMIASIICAVCCYAQTNASMYKVWMEHNVTKNGKLGMVVHADFTVRGLKGKKINCSAYFYDEDKNALKTSHDDYNTASGNVCTWSYDTSTYENTHWSDFHNFIPYEAMNLKAGKHDYYCLVVVWDQDSNELVRSDFHGFSATGSDTRRIYYNDGSYADRTANPDGTSTTVTYSKCTICHGRKACNLCKGAGGTWGGYGNYRRYAICVSCGGDGLCKYCNGTGTRIFTSTYHPSTNTSIGQDFWSGNTYTSGSGYFDDDDHSSHSSSSSNSTCSICHGTKVDPFPLKDPTYNVGCGLKLCYTNYDGNNCPYCDEYVWHQHAKCPKCCANEY